MLARVVPVLAVMAFTVLPSSFAEDGTNRLMEVLEENHQRMEELRKHEAETTFWLEVGSAVFLALSAAGVGLWKASAARRKTERVLAAYHQSRLDKRRAVKQARKERAERRQAKKERLRRGGREG